MLNDKIKVKLTPEQWNWLNTILVNQMQEKPSTTNEMLNLLLLKKVYKRVRDKWENNSFGTLILKPEEALAFFNHFGINQAPTSYEDMIINQINTATAKHLV